MALLSDSDDDPIDLFRRLHWVRSSGSVAGTQPYHTCAKSRPPSIGVTSPSVGVTSLTSPAQWAEIVRKDVAPTHRAILEMGRWKHPAAFGDICTLEAAAKEAMPADAPIVFMLRHTAVECAFELMRVVEENPSACFYVGTSTCPHRRFFGDSRKDFDLWRSGQPAAKRIRPLQRGHCKKYSRMYLLALAERRTAALLEPFLIDALKRRVGGSCNNKVSDARGMDAGMNFLYVVVGDKLDLPPFPRRTSPFALPVG